MMARSMLTAALALAAVLTLGDFAQADDGPPKSGFGGGVVTLGGKGTLADAATATDDVELAHYRRYYGCGYGGGYGYYGGYYGGGYGYSGYRVSVGYYGGYGPGYYGGYGHGYHGGFRPAYHAGLRPGFGYHHGYYRGIAGDADDVNAPAVNLNGTTNQPAPAPTKPYTFKAYGEK